MGFKSAPALLSIQCCLLDKSTDKKNLFLLLEQPSQGNTSRGERQPFIHD